MTRITVRATIELPDEVGGKAIADLVRDGQTLWNPRDVHILAIEDTSALLTLTGIARLTGYDRSTVANWVARYPHFPAEALKVNDRRYWDRSDIVPWLKKMNRFPE